MEMSEKYNFQLIFITLPAFHTYIDNLDKEQLLITISTITNIANTNIAKNSSCHYINYLDDTTFSEEDFFDADHLNELGAKKLSKMINNVITKLE